MNPRGATSTPITQATKDSRAKRAVAGRNNVIAGRVHRAAIRAVNATGRSVLSRVVAGGQENARREIAAHVRRVGISARAGMIARRGKRRSRCRMSVCAFSRIALRSKA